MRGGDLTPLSSGGWSRAGNRNWSVLCDHSHGCCHGGAKVQLDVGTVRVWRCVGVGFSRRVLMQGIVGVKRGGG